MEIDSDRLISILENEELPRRERLEAAQELATWGWLTDLPTEVYSDLFERLFGFWQSLSIQWGNSRTFFFDRASAARACFVLTSGTTEGPTVCWDHPDHSDVEGPRPQMDGGLVRGEFKTSESSDYEYHLEYPIEGVGVRKDLISVVESDGTRSPLLDWCSDEKVFVFCGRCGKDITFEVSRGCPWISLHRRMFDYQLLELHRYRRRRD